MLFRRRKPENFWRRLRTWLWPRRSFVRSLRYFQKRVLRLHATPHAIAAGVASGVFASFTPLLGFHFLLAFILAYLVAGNMAAAALGTAMGNPITFPAIWASTYEIGRSILQVDGVGGIHAEQIGRALAKMDFADLWGPLIQPMIVGAVPLGGFVAFGVYVLVFFAARGFQRRRSLRILERRAAWARRRREARHKRDSDRESESLPEV